MEQTDAAAPDELEKLFGCIIFLSLHITYVADENIFLKCTLMLASVPVGVLIVRTIKRAQRRTIG